MAKMRVGPTGPDPHDSILRHLEMFWSADRIDEVHWTPGHVGDRLPNLHIAKISPESKRDRWTFATVGAWYGTRDSNHNLEFLAVAKSEAASVMWDLALVAYYQAGPGANRLDVGHTIPIGQGWVDGSPLDHVLITLPYLWGTKMENLVTDGRHIRLLWVQPIHAIEAEFRHKHGLEALESRFEEKRIDVLDPFRRPVVSRKDVERPEP